MKLFENYDFTGKIKTFEEFKNPFDRNCVSELHKSKIKEAADVAVTEEVPMLLAVRYRDFVRNGNRTKYEAPYLLRRNNLLKLILAEYILDTGEYLDALIDYIWAICEETSWKLPAHNCHHSTTTDEFYQLPWQFEDNVFFVDLFAAQTAAELAMAYYLLGDKLEAACPLTVVPRMEYEIKRQVLNPFYRNHKEQWWSGFSRPYVNNWNPWIVANILTTITLVETDNEKRAQYAEVCCHAIDHYIKQIPNDGSCDEGASYWGVAGGAVFTFLEVLSDMSDIGPEMYCNETLRYFGEYIIKMHITGTDEPVTFNDMSRRVQYNTSKLWRIGNLVNSELLMNFAGCYHTDDYFSFVSSLPYDTLKFFTANVEKREFTHNKCYYMDKIQIMTARNETTGKKVFVAAKAGANNEGHGHLDNGSFVLYINEKPLFIDVGVGAYTKDTFNQNRFKNWALRSSYHNTPGVDDIEQAPGGKFKTTDVVCDNGVLSFEMKDSFSDSTGIVSVKRTINADKGFSVTDEYEFETERTYKFNLISAAKPSVSGNTLTITTPYGETFEFDITDGYEVSFEEIREESRAVTNWDTDCIYRTVISKKAKNGRFEFVLL